MNYLEKIITEQGQVSQHDVLKVDSFLNHQIDITVIENIADEFYEIFKKDGINKILTIEASGIAIACILAKKLGVPFVFAKKRHTINLTGKIYKAPIHSYTTGHDGDIMVSSDFLNENDRVLIVDDFLAKGSAIRALVKIVSMAGATLIGAGIVIEKGFQRGGDELREHGVRVESLATIESMSDEGIVFRPRTWITSP